jgi:DNA-binding NarL/FixJ family response regulator
MASPVLQSQPAPPAPSDGAAKASIATQQPTVRTTANNLPQDTVTISEEAASLANGGAPSSNAAANATAATAASAASNASIATALLNVAEQIQQLSSQGLSPQQIAWNLNLPVSTVQLYVTPPQAQ